MSKLAARNFSASMRLLKKVEESCATLPALSELRTLPELAARAHIVRSALNARSLFENFHRRIAGISEALAEYQVRKRRIASGTTGPRASSGAGADTDATGGGAPAVTARSRTAPPRR